MKTVNNIVTKDTVIVKLEGYAEGHYSNSKAYGSIYIPIEVYKENEELICGADVLVYELDGKHSKVPGETEVIINTLENFLMNTDIKRNYSGEYEVDLDDKLLSEIEDVGQENMRLIRKLSCEILNLAERLDKETKIKLYLDKDTEINGAMYPKETLIEINKNIGVEEGILFVL